MTTLNLIVDRAGEYACGVNGEDAYIIGETEHCRYLVTPMSGHVWHDAGGSRCSDLGRIDCPAMPPGDARSEAYEEWAAAVLVAAHEAGVRIDGA